MNVYGVSGAGMALVNRETQESLQVVRDQAVAERERAIEASNVRREIPPPDPVPTGTDTSRVDLYL